MHMRRVLRRHFIGLESEVIVAMHRLALAARVHRVDL